MKCWLWMVQGRFFSLPFASPVVFWASEMPCEQNSDTVCRRAATAAYFFCIWHIGKCQWFLVSRMLCYFVPRCQIAVEKHRSELKQVSMDQADSGGGLGWGFFCGWVLGFFFFLSRRHLYVPENTSLCTSLYTRKRQSKLHPEFLLFIFLWCILHINVAENRMTTSHLKIFFFFLEPRNPYPKINNL